MRAAAWGLCFFQDWEALARWTSSPQWLWPVWIQLSRPPRRPDPRHLRPMRAGHRRLGRRLHIQDSLVQERGPVSGLHFRGQLLHGQPHNPGLLPQRRQRRDRDHLQQLAVLLSAVLLV